MSLGQSETAIQAAEEIESSIPRELLELTTPYPIADGLKASYP